MKFSVPYKALILIADGHNATLFQNVSETGVSLEESRELPVTVGDDKGAARTPHETSPNQQAESL